MNPNYAGSFVLRAQQVANCGGFSAGYYDGGDNEQWWAVPYPEVTGYLIPTLLRWNLIDQAVAAGDWLTRVQKPDGGIPGYLSLGSSNAFDTGQVLLGWLALQGTLEADRWDPAIAEAVRYLETTDFSEHLSSEDNSYIPACYARVAWPLKIAGSDGWQRYADFALDRMDEDGWVWEVQDGRPDEPLSHFVVYVARAMHELGFDSEANLMSDGLRSVQRPDGSIPAYLGAGWEDRSPEQVCIPAVAQASVLFYRMGEVEAADRALSWLDEREFLWASEPHDADYLPNFAPLWSYKFYLDACWYREREADDGRE